MKQFPFDSGDGRKRLRWYGARVTGFYREAGDEVNTSPVGIFSRRREGRPTGYTAYLRSLRVGASQPMAIGRLMTDSDASTALFTYRRKQWKS